MAPRALPRAQDFWLISSAPFLRWSQGGSGSQGGRLHRLLSCKMKFALYELLGVQQRKHL